MKGYAQKLLASRLRLCSEPHTRYTFPGERGEAVLVMLDPKPTAFAVAENEHFQTESQATMLRVGKRAPGSRDEVRPPAPDPSVSCST